MEKSQEIIDIEEELSNFKELSSIKDSKAGKLLIKSLQRDISSTLATILTLYKEGTESHLRAMCAKLDSDSALLLVFTNAEKNRDQAQEILDSMNE